MFLNRIRHNPSVTTLLTIIHHFSDFDVYATLCDKIAKFVHY